MCFQSANRGLRKNSCPIGVNIAEKDQMARKNGGYFFVPRKQLFGDPRFLHFCGG